MNFFSLGIVSVALIVGVNNREDVGVAFKLWWVGFGFVEQ